LLIRCLKSAGGFEMAMQQAGIPQQAVTSLLCKNLMLCKLGARPYWSLRSVLISSWRHSYVVLFTFSVLAITEASVTPFHLSKFF
jgi:hypothetical protein